jgi:hypothetical protein
VDGHGFEFSEEDVKEAANTMNPGRTERSKYYAKITGKLYPVRPLFVTMIKRKGFVAPGVGPYRAIRVLRALGFEIIEV